MSVRIFISTLLMVALFGCAKVELFEKVVFTPKQQWSNSFQPVIEFDIQDTTSMYRLYFTIRHADAYAYNNIWIKLHSKLPGDSIERQDRYEIPLATEKRWLGSGMGDVYDHRVFLYKDPVKFTKKGLYTLRLEHDMRVDPLEYVFNVGIRIEKVN